MQGYDVNFRPGTETERDERPAQTEAHVERAPLFAVHVLPFRIEVLRGGDHPKSMNCMPCVWPERVSWMSVCGSTLRFQWLGSWLSSTLNTAAVESVCPNPGTFP